MIPSASKSIITDEKEKSNHFRLNGVIRGLVGAMECHRSRLARFSFGCRNPLRHYCFLEKVNSTPAPFPCPAA